MSAHGLGRASARALSKLLSPFHSRTFALDELGKRGHIGILQVPKSKLGRKGLVAVRGEKGLSFSSTYGAEADPCDFEDIFNGLYSMPLGVQGSETPLGDNEQMGNTLRML